MVSDLRPERVALLGFPSDNGFTSSIPGKHDFYDLQLGNWNINWNWVLARQDYDLIVCTRCPYFASDPDAFVKKCRAHLGPNGKMFLDWGLGDHWRFEKYKVGWVRDGEHEYFYTPDNFLHSCLWRSEFVQHPEVKKFWDNVRGRYGYSVDDDLDAVVRREVPRIVDYDFDSIRFKSLWSDAPQLYIMTLG